MVSVIIPTFNRPKLLRRALSSVAAQLYRPLEVVVVNDAGEDVADIVRAFASELQLQYVVNAHNRYLAESRNVGLAHASGTLLGYLDDDDLLYPHHVGHLVTLVENHAAQALPHAWTRESLLPYAQRPLEPQELLVENLAPVQSFLHHRSVLEHLRPDPFDSSLCANEDWDFWIRVRALGPITQSPMLTSCVDMRHQEGAMSQNLSAFYSAHQAVYRKHTVASAVLGLTEEQHERLSELRAQAWEQLRARRSIAHSAESTGDLRGLAASGADYIAVGFDASEAAMEALLRIAPDKRVAMCQGPSGYVLRVTDLQAFFAAHEDFSPEAFVRWATAHHRRVLS